MHRSVCLWLVIGATPAFADEVVLRGGGRVTGVVVEQTADRVVIETAPGRVALPTSRIVRIVSSSSDVAVFEERAARLDAGDAEGWLALGLWARSQGLLTRAQAAFSRVLEIEPDNAEAHTSLGHVFLAGRWMTLSESYAARGLVEFEGVWLTPQERAEALRARTEEALAWRAVAEAEARAREAEARASAAEAEARRLEAEAQATSLAPGIPLWWAYSGGNGGMVTPYVRRGWVHRRHGRVNDAGHGRPDHQPHPDASGPSVRPTSLGPVTGQSGSRTHPRTGGGSSLR